jgi:hypothetical protein
MSAETEKLFQNKLSTKEIRNLNRKYPHYQITVNYDTPIEELVVGVDYAWHEPGDINSEHFPSTEKGEIQMDIYLVSFDHHTTIEESIKEINNQGLRPATLKELLSLEKAYRFVLRASSIYALGSEWTRKGYHYKEEVDVFVPTAHNDPDHNFRSLSLTNKHTFDHPGLDPHRTFAAVIK